MNYNWNWGIFWELSPDASGTYLETLFYGLGWTLALAIGILVGTMRTTPIRWVVMLGNGFTELFRNIPLLVQMFLWFFVVPELLPTAVGDWVKQLPNASFWTAVAALALFTSARVAEQVRAGIQSLPSGQMAAGVALGMTLPQTYRHVVLPAALRVVLPPLTSEFLNIIKNSSVALTIGLMELTARTRAMQEFSFQVFEAFTAATLIYLLINGLVVLGMRRVENWLAVPGYLGGKAA
jgi:glutamate/aspartate transport system permease protein